MVLSARKHATYSHLVVTQFGQDRVSLFSHDHIYIYIRIYNSSKTTKMDSTHKKIHFYDFTHYVP